MSPSMVAAVILIPVLSAACGRADADAGRPRTSTPPVTVTAVAVAPQEVAGFVSASGTLVAENDADVAAEVAGRIVATPAERGARVGSGAALIHIANTEAEAQAVEAAANAAQIEARLGLAEGAPFDVDRVPEVANAKAAFDLAISDFERADTLRQRQLLSRADFDQRAAQRTAAERQYETARNSAAQQYQSLLAARARAVVARKALSDTVVRAPFDGVIGERFVSVGDFVSRGTKVVSVLGIDPLRVQLTVSEQEVAAIAVGRAVTFAVDAYPGESFTGHIRYVSPAVTADTRALTVEASVANPQGRLKPGFFARARIERGSTTPRLLVATTAVREVNGAARLFVVEDDRAKERVVTIGEAIGDLVEVKTGLASGERVITAPPAQVVDGARVTAR